MWLFLIENRLRYFSVIVDDLQRKFGEAIDINTMLCYLYGKTTGHYSDRKAADTDEYKTWHHIQ